MIREYIEPGCKITNNFYVNLSNSLRNQPKIYLHWTGRAFAAVDARRIFSSGMVKSE